MSALEPVQAMLIRKPGEAAVPVWRPLPSPAPDELLIRIEACGVCRTDLHIADGELPQASYPIVPGHEVVGTVQSAGSQATLMPGQRVGVPWLAQTCGECAYCRIGQENLCDRAQFTGCSRDGGFSTHMVAKAAYCVPLDARWGESANVAPLLCAGLIGWRALNAARPFGRLGLYGFGAAAHIATQVACHEGAEVFAFTRPGDHATQSFARSLGARWSGGSDEPPPRLLDAAILFAPVGALVPVALEAVRKGGRVVCAGIHMSDIPQFPYRLLWGERHLLSVANLTRDDAHSFFAGAAARVRTHVIRYRLEDANQALADLRTGRIEGAAVLVPPQEPG